MAFPAHQGLERCGPEHGSQPDDQRHTLAWAEDDRDWRLPELAAAESRSRESGRDTGPTQVALHITPRRQALAAARTSQARTQIVGAVWAMRSHLGSLFFGVPLALVIGGLNARAGGLEVRELQARR